MAIRLGIEAATELGEGLWEARLSPQEVDALGRSRQRYGDKSIIAVHEATYDGESKLLSIDSGDARVLNRGSGSRVVIIQFEVSHEDEDEDEPREWGRDRGRDRGRSRSRSREQQRRQARYAERAAKAASRAERNARRASERFGRYATRYAEFGEQVAREILESLSAGLDIDIEGGFKRSVDDEEVVEGEAESLDLGEGDRKFVAMVDELLPGHLAQIGTQFIVGVRQQFEGDLVEGEARKFVDSPYNFWSVTVQPRDASLALTAKGEMTDFPWATIELRPDRPGHVRFKILSADDLTDALSILFASGGRHAASEGEAPVEPEPPVPPVPPAPPVPPTGTDGADDED